MRDGRIMVAKLAAMQEVRSEIDRLKESIKGLRDYQVENPLY